MHHARIGVVAMTLGAACAVPSRAQAQNTTDCDRLATSQAQTPALGTLMDLAACHEKLGRTATAWAEFNDAASQARRRGLKDRERLATQRIEALDKRLHRVLITLARTNDPLSLTIRLDGDPLSSSVVGTQLPLDPGPHTIEVEAPGKKTWSKPFSIAGAGQTQIEIPALEAVSVTPVTSPPSSTAEPRSEPAATRPAPVDRVRLDGSSKRAVGFVTAGAGVVALVVGGYFGLRALRKDNDSNAAAADRSIPDVATRQANADLLHSQALSAQTIALVVAGAGIALVSLGAFLVLSSPEAPGARSALLIAPAAGGAEIGWQRAF